MFKLTIIVLVALVAFTSAGTLVGGITGQVAKVAGGSAAGVIGASSNGVGAAGVVAGQVGEAAAGAVGGSAVVNENGAEVDVNALGQILGLGGVANVDASINKDGIKVGADGVLAL